MAFILIDRRKSGKGKSIPNRQKLVRRIKSFIKASLPQNIGAGGILGQTAKHTSPVKVSGAALEEPWFGYSNDGEQTAVIIGNDEYERGDEIIINTDEASEKGKGGGAGRGSGDSEDDFIVNVAREEFFSAYFEDCELPNLTNEKYTEKLDNTFQNAGFSSTGSPSQLSVIRTYKQALSRQMVLEDPFEDEKKKLELELAALLEAPALTWIGQPTVALDRENRISWIKKRLKEIDLEFISIDNFDNSDLRYRRKEAKPLKTVDAVIFFIMDISSSMTADHKLIARRWFALFYAFIKRRYPATELVFVAHTDKAYEMSENDFFSTKLGGGTEVSSGLKMVNSIIKERYDPNQVNIYALHASDGDNWDADNVNVINEMVGAGKLTSALQLFTYVQVGKTGAAHFFNTKSNDDTGLWKTYDSCRSKVKDKKISLVTVETPDDVYPIFKKVFKKEGK